jgi:hypothetical protein
VLERHDVAYVVIGGIGARIWGSPKNTDDLDICAATDRANLGRFALALNELDARFRTVGVANGCFSPPARWDGRSFDSFTAVALTTRLGWLDVSFRPDGTKGYVDLVKRAAEAEVGGVCVRVASLDDIIRSKEAADRPKHRADLHVLHELRRLRRRTSEGGVP